MSKKKQTIVLSVIGAATILVLMVGVTFAYFTSTMRGEAANTNVSTKLIGGISFTAQAVDGSEILPGWTSGAKTVTVTAEASDVDMEYSCTLNITENGLSDLKLTLSGDNYVTENNNAMLGTTAVTIAKGTIPAREEVTTKTMTYTISLPETGENQTEGNSGKNFAATVSCKLDNEIQYYEGSNNVVATNFYDKLLADNPTRLTRTSFDANLTDTNTGTLYRESGNWTEGGKTVYYFAGGAQNNWVKFGKSFSSTCTYDGKNIIYLDFNTGMKEHNLTEDECTTTNVCKADTEIGLYYVTGLNETECNAETVGIEGTYTYLTDKATFAGGERDIYWRIIRTNEDGSIRLLYVGGEKDTTDNAVIGESGFSRYDENVDHDSNGGYMYGTDGSLANHRTNENDSPIKEVVDSWYSEGLYITTDGSYTYDSYVSKTAIYCNDRSVESENFGVDDTKFGARQRLWENNRPSYKCGNSPSGSLYSTASVEDKFSASTSSGGNGDLTYPVALMTADEIVYAGGKYNEELTSSFTWYLSNSNGEEITNFWWTMTPYYQYFDVNNNVSGTTSMIRSHSKLDNSVSSNTNGVRPVLSLKSCTLTTGGNGSSTSPYEITIDETCAASEN